MGGKLWPKVKPFFVDWQLTVRATRAAGRSLKNVPYGPTLSSSTSELSEHVGTLTVAVMIFFQHTGILTDTFLIHHLPNHIKSAAKARRKRGSSQDFVTVCDTEILQQLGTITVLCDVVWQWHAKLWGTFGWVTRPPRALRHRGS